MPPEDRFVCRFAAEPPQDPLPYGRWADTLQAEFLAAALRIDTEGTIWHSNSADTWRKVMSRDSETPAGAAVNSPVGARF